MGEAELDSKYEDSFTRNTTSDTLNTQNSKDDKNINVEIDLKMTDNINTPLDYDNVNDLNVEGDLCVKKECENSENSIIYYELEGEHPNRDTEADLKTEYKGDESQKNKSSDLLKELSIPIELDPDFGPEKVPYDINDLNIPIQLDEMGTPTNLKSLVEKLDIPCDSKAIKAEIENSKQKYERNILTRYARRNDSLSSSLKYKLNGISYKNQMDTEDLSTNLNFRELSKKLDLNKNNMDISSKLLRSSKMRMNKINLDDFSKLDMNKLGSMDMIGTNKLDISQLNMSTLANMNMTKLDVNSLGKLDINNVQELGYTKYLESTNDPMMELKPLNELRGLDEMKGINDMGLMSKLRSINELGCKTDGSNELQYGVPANDQLAYGNEYRVNEMNFRSEMNYVNEQKLSESKYVNEIKSRGEMRGRKKKGMRPKGGTMIPQPLGSATMANQVELPPLTVENWAQCENCKKWRRIPLSVDTEKLPDTWVCSLNIWDPLYNSCSIPEEIYPEKMIDQKVTGEGNVMNTPVNSASPDQSFLNESEAKYDNYVPALKYGENVDLKYVRDRLKAAEGFKTKYVEPKYRGRYRSQKETNNKDTYFENKYRTSKRGKQKYGNDSNRKLYDEAYIGENMSTPTNVNRYGDEPRLSSRRRMHISPMVSNLSSYDEDAEVIKFKVKKMTEGSAHPLQDRMTLYSHNLTSLLATELPHSALFLDNLKKMNLIRDDDIRDEYGLGDGKLSVHAREPSLYIKEKDSVFLKEDGNINLAFANKTSWVHSDGSKHTDKQNVKFNKEDVFDNMVSFEELESQLSGVSRTDFARMYKRLSTQIPKISEIVKLKEDVIHDRKYEQLRLSAEKGSDLNRDLTDTTVGEVGHSSNGNVGAEEKEINVISPSNDFAYTFGNGDMDGASSSTDVSNNRSTNLNVKRERFDNEFDENALEIDGEHHINGCNANVNEMLGSNTANAYEANVPDKNGLGERREKRNYENSTKVVNRDELLEVLYSFAKQYYSGLQELDEYSRLDQEASTENVNTGESSGTTGVSKIGSAGVNGANARNFSIGQVAKDTNTSKFDSGGNRYGIGDGFKRTVYCKRHKYVEDVMQSIIEYKEQVLDKLKEEMEEAEAAMKQQSSLEEYEDTLKKDAKVDSGLLDAFKDDDDLLNKGQSDESEDDDGNKDSYSSERLERELENELKKELLEKELEKKLMKKDLMRNEKNKNLEYPLPNIKQLSKRCRNLECKSLRHHSTGGHYTSETTGTKFMSSYSMLFQPIPDDVTKANSNLNRDSIIKMLSIPIPCKQLKEEEYEGRDGLMGVSSGALSGSGGNGSSSYPNSSNSSTCGGLPSRGLTTGSVMLSVGHSSGGGTPFASGVVATSDLINGGVIGMSAGMLSSSGGSSATSALSSGGGLAVANNGVKSGVTDDYKPESYDNFGLLSLPIPDLSNKATLSV